MVSKQEPAVHRIDPEQLTEDQLAEWEDLLTRQPDPANPFCAPEWVTAWYRAHVPDPADRHLLLVRDAAGTLTGIAPMHLSRSGHPRLGVRRLLLVGAGRRTPLELPQVLTAAGAARQVHTDLAAHLLDLAERTGADWSELALDREQAWFEPAWVQASTAPAPFYEHRAVRACVVLPLDGTWDQLRSGLKRNLKESLRRGRNRLTKSGVRWEIRTLTGADLDDAAVERFFHLHTQRSGFTGTSSTHPDAYADPTARALLADLLPRLAARGRASLVELVVDGRVGATQLALHAPGCSYVHSSGMDPDYWDYSPVTLLHAEVVRAAVERGDRVVNFSPGPNVSKLRWSERLTVHDDFAFATAGRAAGLRYAAFDSVARLNRFRRGVATARANSPVPVPTATTTPRLLQRALTALHLS
ncbi:GNAT family N-acetyltransferase [Kineococcus glutinatus]|uniref:BioF2-like acetyltransferase domain-containing protein n=1 Tax=Kineococcus glutinatus TaxID=1070872 RepID=A0ABP9I598_9ACTN